MAGLAIPRMTRAGTDLFRVADSRNTSPRRKTTINLKPPFTPDLPMSTDTTRMASHSMTFLARVHESRPLGISLPVTAGAIA